jgi:uncharacterized damage-inducible protein DinB
MAITDALLPEYDHEMGTTRRLLDRVPEAEFAWKPHEKSMSLGELAGHLANIPTWMGRVIASAEFDMSEAAPGQMKRVVPTSRAALLTEFDAKVAEARANLAGRTDAELLAPWTLRNDGEEVFTLPKISALRSFVMNHSIHHRGQLSVYLRLKNVPLPSIYGPTADEA